LMTYEDERPDIHPDWSGEIDFEATERAILVHKGIYAGFDSLDSEHAEYLAAVKRNVHPLDPRSTAMQAIYQYNGRARQSLFGTFKITYEDAEGDTPLDRTLRDLGIEWEVPRMAIREEPYALVSLDDGALERPVRKVGGVAQLMEFNNHMDPTLDEHPELS